jgi:GT2 family glycosyltransferase
MVTDIVIPVRDQLHYTQSILKQLREMKGWNHCWIFDNGSEDGTKEWLWEYRREFPRFSVIPSKGKGIYEMWDFGMYTARFADHILFLNNDVTLHPETVVALNDALSADDSHWIAYPDVLAVSPMAHMCNYKTTKGTYRHGGMTGFCFMVKRNKISWTPLVDPQFIWWGGDDDIAFEVEKRGGKQVKVVGLPIEHYMEGTARHHDLGAQKAADLEAVIKKWGR